MSDKVSAGLFFMVVFMLLFPSLIWIWDGFMWLLDIQVLKSWIDWTINRQMAVAAWTLFVVSFGATLQA